MKKMNKKGFTLAELLIVVAIIAVLIAIAIPTFSGALDNAKIQTDHANMRNAYAMARTIELTGVISADMVKSATTDQAVSALSANAVYYYTVDGLLASSGDEYMLKATPSNGDPCIESQVCTVDATATPSTTNHEKGHKIKLTVIKTTGKVTVEIE